MSTYGGRQLVTTNNQYIVGYVDWYYTQYIDGNYTDVSADLYLYRNNTGYTTSGTGYWELWLYGGYNSVSKHVDLSYNSNTWILNYSPRIYHNADGTGGFSMAVSGGISGTSYTSSWLTNGNNLWINLPTIPRASQPSCNASATLGDTNFAINWTRASSSFTHRVFYSAPNGSAIEIGSGGYTTGCTWATIPLSIANNITNATSGTVTIRVDTYNGSTLIGSKYTTFTANVPSSIIPTCGAITISEQNSAVTSAGIGKLVQSLSTMRVAVGNGTGSYGSTIVAYSITVNGSAYTGQTKDILMIASGTPTFSVKCQDSRGRWSNAITTVTTGSGLLPVLAYTPPTISSFDVNRCTSGHTLDDMGDYGQVVRACSVSSLMNSTEKNTMTAIVYYKENPSGSWTAFNTVNSGLSVSGTLYSGSNLFTATKSYDWKLVVTDKFNTTTFYDTMPVGMTIFSMSDQGIGVGKIWQQGALDVSGYSYFDSYPTITVPPVRNQIRYIRNYIRGNTANISNHWVGLEAYAGATNYATSGNGCTVQGIYSSGGTLLTPNASYPLANLIDGNTATWTTPTTDDANSQQYVQIDLGQLRSIDTIKVWHYWSDSRKYYANRTDISVDGTTWYCIYDNSNGVPYAESSSGLSMLVPYKASLMNFNTERPWKLVTRYSLADQSDSYLGLMALVSGGKQFKFMNTDESHNIGFVMGNTACDIQFDGIPLVEYGNNANGEYWRFYNGLQICKMNTSYTPASCYAWGSIFAMDFPTWTYPASFISNPVAMANTSNPDSIWFMLRQTGATSTLVYGLRGTTMTPTLEYYALTAIGRWK